MVITKKAEVDERPRAMLSWSSGKDSAFTLETLLQDGHFQVAGLLTTVNAEANRVAMHAVRDELHNGQAAALGLPLMRVDLPSPCTNEQYEIAMRGAVSKISANGINHMAFGDLFLEDVRRYREERLTGTEITPVFPLWKRDTRQLAHDILDSGVRAIVTCVDPSQIRAIFVGRDFDAAFLAELPASCDPCGENGEFHTFVWDSPSFRHPIRVARGATIERDGFHFADLVAA